MCTVLLPPGGYPIAVNKYIISYHIVSYHNIGGIRIEIRNRCLPNVNSNTNEATATSSSLSIITVVFGGFLSLFCLELLRIHSHCLIKTHLSLSGAMYKCIVLQMKLLLFHIVVMFYVTHRYSLVFGCQLFGEYAASILMVILLKNLYDLTLR